MITISVIICAYTELRWTDLQAAFDSVRRQHVQAHEIIAVIDYNPALERRVSTTYRDVVTVRNRGTRGLSGARNTGVGCARGTIIVFMDDDAVAEPDWLGRMAGHYADPAVLGVGGRIVPVWPNGRPRWFPEEFDWVVGCSYRGLPEVVAPVRNLIGCNMSFRRSLFDEIGGFREEIGRAGSDGSGCEETEFCIRARQVNPKSVLIYDPAIVVHHHLAPERATWRYFRSRCRAEGRSKSLVVAQVGASPGLSSERRHVARVLPAGLMRGLRDSALRFDAWGLVRAGAILSGFAYVTWSYVAARYVTRSRSDPKFSAFRVLDLDLAHPLPRIGPDDRHANAFCLVRRDGHPLGALEVPLDGNGLLPSDLAARLLREPDPPSAWEPAPPRLSGEAPFISVVVATRDRPASLAACLDSLLRQDYPSFEVVVVDNAPSSTETADLVATRYVPKGRVRYLREDKPGLGRAHNHGLANVVAPIVAFTDDDVIVDPHWLTAFAANFTASSQIACVTGLILPAELETRAQYWVERHGGFGKGFARKLYDAGENRRPGLLFPYAAGQFGSGANMAFRLESLRRIGGFDPALGAGTPARGGDDLAAFFEVIQAGYQLVYEPRAIVWHHHRRDEVGVRRQAFGYGVGLGAYLTKLVLDRPATLLHLAAAFPAGLAHLMSPSSPKNARLADDYPATLVWRERLGILAGVPSYLRSRAASRRSANTATGPSSHTFLPASDRQESR